MLALKNDKLMGDLDGGKIIIVRGPFVNLNGIEVSINSQQLENAFFFLFCLRCSLYNATPQFTVSHFTVIVHIAKFWQLIGAVPWYGSDLGYSYSL